VIDFVDRNFADARGVVAAAVARTPFDRLRFDAARIDALLEWFLHLADAKRRMMGLRPGAPAEERTALRDGLLADRRAALGRLSEADWLDLRLSAAGISRFKLKPSRRILAFLRALRALSAAAHGGLRPSLIYGFTVEGYERRFAYSRSGRTGYERPGGSAGTQQNAFEAGSPRQRGRGKAACP
jgi:hypothetical protein